MIQAVIFDLDDTLVKTHVVKWAQHKAIAKDRFGRELTEARLREHWGKPFETLISALHQDEDTIENLLKLYAATTDDFPKEIQRDSMGTIRALLERGIQLGVVTATTKDFVLKDMKRLDFPLEEFFCIQAADDTEFHKPDPRVFDPILRKLQEMGIEKEGTVYVGDALTDFYAARDAGLDFIAVTTGLNSAEEFKAIGVSKVLSSLGELPAIIS
jgi:HAD superfamily hydrolase (TIGR01549 family)